MRTHSREDRQSPALSSAVQYNFQEGTTSAIYGQNIVTITAVALPVQANSDPSPIQCSHFTDTCRSCGHPGSDVTENGDGVSGMTPTAAVGCGSDG